MPPPMIRAVLLHQAIADRLGLNLTDHKARGFVLDAGAPITAGQLAARTGLTTGAITGIVDRLENAGSCGASGIRTTGDA